MKMANFIDKTFVVLADILLQILPLDMKSKRAFLYYRAGLRAQARGNYSEALENYYEALKLEENPRDRSFILSNIGLVYIKTGKDRKALEYLHQALDLNSELPQAYYHIGLIYHRQGTRAELSDDSDERKLAKRLFDRAGVYWRKAIELVPDLYMYAQNWLKVTGRSDRNSD